MSRSPTAGRTRLDEQARRERLEQFHNRLSQQVLSLTSGTKWAAWLATAARFHHYSFGNTIAIWMQRPDATQVAGYRLWQSLGRQVRKGEQGIQILAPLTRRADDPNPADDADPAAARPPGHDEPETTVKPAGRSVVGYRIAHVFDITQTDGDPLPGSAAITPSLLTGAAPERLWDGLAHQVDEAGYTLSIQALGNGANGQTNHAQRHVRVVPDLDPAHQVKTLAHELGHVLLHQPDLPSGRWDPMTFCRGRVEVEAESIAFLITSAHGIDSSAFSFPYVAGWAQRSTDVEATLRDTASRVLATAHQVLDRLDRDNPQPLPVAEDTIPYAPLTPTRAMPAHPPDHALQHGTGVTRGAGVAR